MDNPFQSPAVISFCPGILGIERGLARAGVHCRVAAYVEIEAFIIANLVTGMEAGILDPAPIWTDAKTFDARPFRGRIHGIIGGYPCPGESLAGLREGHLYKGFIWPPIRRAIAAARPLWCFFENVDDHLTGTYPIVQRSLHNMGYRVEAGIFTAEEVGAPHERKRLFILALADSTRERIRREAGNIFKEDGGSISKLSVESIGSGEKLANGHSYGYGTGTGRIVEAGSENEEKAQREKRYELFRQWLWDVTGDGSKKLVDTPRICERKQANKTDTITTERETWDEPRYRGKFVAGQGNVQYPWEHRRTIEPGMGCAINGYNFREDILRALGNSVVEQTAELAFIDLLRKHIA